MTPLGALSFAETCFDHESLERGLLGVGRALLVELGKPAGMVELNC